MNDRCPTCHRPYSKGRSNNQNRYYWGVIVKLLSDHTGFTDEEINEILKHQFLSKQKTWNDMVFYIPKSTSSLKTTEMEEYLSKVRRWASETLEVFIPDPNEYIETEMLVLKGQNKQRPVPINRLDQ